MLSTGLRVSEDFRPEIRYIEISPPKRSVTGREKEELARDVFQVLFKMWNQPVFADTACSEQAHMDAVKTLIDQHGLKDPVAGNGPGEFADPELQTMYDSHMHRGCESGAEALHSRHPGHMAETTALDSLRVHENLLRGSRNHLRAFVSTPEGQTSEHYTPEHLDQHTYEGIVGDAVESGPKGSWRGGAPRCALSDGEGTDAVGRQRDTGRDRKDVGKGGPMTGTGRKRRAATLLQEERSKATATSEVTRPRSRHAA